MIKRLRHSIAHLGWIDSLWYLLSRLLGAGAKNSSLFKYYIVVQSTSRAANLMKHHGANIEVREIYDTDSILSGIPRDLEVIRARYRNGARCFGAFKEQQLIAYIWLQWHAYAEDEVRCRFVLEPKNKVVWTFDVFVMPEHRFGLGFVKLWSEIELWLRGQGIIWTISRISAFNLRSRTSHQRLGLHTLGSCVFIKLGKWQWMFSTLPPRVHFSTDPTHFPEITLLPPK